MSSGLYSGVSGLALGVGLYKGVGGLWGGASGLIDGFGGFNPAAVLFGAGEPGGWYDPSDLSTMFQDTAGTVPVTATGQTVGLLLDKSQGLVLGPEKVSNGTFDGNSTAGWVAGFGLVNGTFIASGGVATLTQGSSDTAPRFVTTLSGLTVGASYRLNFTSAAQSGSGDKYVVWTSSAGGTGGNTLNQGSGGGWAGQSRSFLVTATATTMYVAVGLVSGTTGSSVSIDNISVKELAGNHLTQATAASRPIYGIEPFGGRRNLLVRTEEFDNAAWVKNNTTVTANTTVAPDGTSTADLVISNTTGGVAHNIYSSVTISAATHSLSFYAKQGGYTGVRVANAATGTGANFDLANGVVFGTPSAGFTASIQSAGNGWYRCSITFTATAGANLYGVYIQQTPGTTVYAGDGTSGIFLWGAQLETGSLATPYQRVTDQWNVTEAGVPSVSYVQYDGTDDWFISPTITPGIDKAQVFAGVRKLSDAASGLVVETSASIATNNGAIRLSAPFAAAANYAFFTKGVTESPVVSSNSFAAPITNVLAGIGDIAADTAILRVNGTQVATSATDQGTGNYLAYPLYVGRRGGISIPFNGRIYSLIVRFGANLDAATIAATENYTASKTGIYTLDQLIRLNVLNASGVSFNAYAATDADGNNYPVTNNVLAADGTPYSVL